MFLDFDLDLVPELDGPVWSRSKSKSRSKSTSKMGAGSAGLGCTL